MLFSNRATAARGRGGSHDGRLSHAYLVSGGAGLPGGDAGHGVDRAAARVWRERRRRRRRRCEQLARLRPTRQHGAGGGQLFRPPIGESRAGCASSRPRIPALQDLGLTLRPGRTRRGRSRPSCSRPGHRPRRRARAWRAHAHAVVPARLRRAVIGALHPLHGTSGSAATGAWGSSRSSCPRPSTCSAAPSGPDIRSRPGSRWWPTRRPEPVQGEFRRTFEEQRFGLPFEDSLMAMSDRVGLVDVRILTTAILIQREVGGNLAEILDNLAQHDPRAVQDPPAAPGLHRAGPDERLRPGRCSPSWSGA